jgi:ribose transport system permease protein
MTGNVETFGTETTRKKEKEGLAGLAGRFGLLGLLVILWIFFSIMRPESFATIDNFRLILDQKTLVVLLAFAAMMPLIIGRFDLSVAAMMSFSNVLVVGLIVKQGLPAWAAILIAIAVSAFLGLVNGAIVVRFKVDAFVATLGTSSIIDGIANAYSGGRAIQDLEGKIPKGFNDITREQFLGIPQAVLIVGVIAVIVGIVLSALPVGRRMYATGGNERAAQLTGIATNLYVIGSFVAAGLLAGIAGVLSGSRLGTATPGSSGSMLLPAFAGAFLGATTIRPGRFNVLGAIIAVYMLAVAVSGLQQMTAPIWLREGFNGTALVVAVAASQWALSRRRARARQKEIAALDEAQSTAP